MENKLCRICSSKLEVKKTCKFCNEPTWLFCHICGKMAEKRAHPVCMIIDVNRMMMTTHSE